MGHAARNLALIGALAALGSCSKGAAGPVIAPPEPEQAVEGIQRAVPVAFFPSDELTSSATRDGRYLVFVSDETGNLDIWQKDFRTDDILPMTSDPADDVDPAVSPDSKRIAFVSRRSDAKGDIYLLDIDGGRPDRLTGEATKDRQPVFAADGKRIYFTSSAPIGLDFIAAVDLDGAPLGRISPTPGFDPAPSPDGEYLIYTAPEGVGGRRHPHLVAMRLSDSATVAITPDDGGISGFARFFPGGDAIAYVRFADDDTGDGQIDSNDQASLWRLDLDLPALFKAGGDAAERGEPFPLTAGNRDELFPDPVGRWLYYTETSGKGQDVVRLPLGGMFPASKEAKDYFELAKTLADPRERWFAYRAVLAVTRPQDLLHTRALLAIANGHLDTGRRGLARSAFEQLVAAAAGAGEGQPEAELAGIAKAELVSLDREDQLARATTPIERERILLSAQASLEALLESHGWAPRVVARVDLELAHVVHDRGDRVAAIEAFDRVAKKHSESAYSAAKAMIERTRLLEVAFDPDALGEAYANVIRLFPDQRKAVLEAAAYIVDAQLKAASVESPADWRKQSDAIRRILLRTDSPPVRLVARRRLADMLRENGEFGHAAVELERLSQEAEAAGDRVAASEALAETAVASERSEDLDGALQSWGKLRQKYGDLPGVIGSAREAITRVAMQKAALEEERGRPEDARGSYRAVIENDYTQVRAHRRFFALSAQTGKGREALEEARARAEASPRTPMARYAYALALTWADPPPLDDALTEVEAALRLNQQFVHAYITRGWVREMLELEDPGEGHLESAIEAYQVAERLNNESEDPRTEAEIKLNLGNARWRLGDQVNDPGNLAAAFRDYMERFVADAPFESREAELVFYERLGRAAAWAGEYAISAMASREALAIAEQIDVRARTAQILGNLALAYSQAGESEAATAAFEKFAGDLEKRNAEARLVIARRNRAIAKLETFESTGSGDVEGALEDLSKAREALVKTGVPFCAGPGIVFLVPDATRAQLCFNELDERDLNLSWAEDAHRGRLEVRRADQIRRVRRSLVKERAEDSKNSSLGVVREHLGMLLGDARAKCRRADALGCAARLREADEMLADLDKKLFERDWDALQLDRARVAAIAAEELARLGAASGQAATALLPELEAWLDAAMAETDRIEKWEGLHLERAKDAVDRELLLFAPVSTTSTLSAGEQAKRDAERAKAKPEAREARAVRARLLHARGLLALADGERATPPQAKDLGELLGGLDRAVAAADKAAGYFSAAAQQAQTAPEGLGGVVLSAAGHGLAEAERRAGRHESAAKIAGAASSFARTLGALDVALRFELAGALAGGEEQIQSALDRLDESVPVLLRPADPLVQRLLVRSASLALAKGEIERAFNLTDQELLSRQALGPSGTQAVPRTPLDRKFVELYRAAAARHQQARAELARVKANAPSWERESRTEQLALAEERLLAMTSTPASDAIRARVLGAPVGLDKIKKRLRGGEALLVPSVIGDRLELFLVDGSTLAKERLLHASSERPAGEVRSEIESLRTALLEGRAVDAALAAKVEGALLSPFSAVLESKRAVILADRAIGGPIPAWALPVASRLGFSHLSAPSALIAVKSAEIVGTRGTVAIGAPDDPPLVEATVRISAAEAAALRTPPVRPAADTDERTARRLADRSAVERLRDRAQDILVVEPEVELEPMAVERSAIRLAPEPEGASQVREEDKEVVDFASDRFLREAPLAALSIPARSVVLARVSGAPDDALALDLALAQAGFPTAVVVPKQVPREAARRIVSKYLATAGKLGPVRAIKDAIAGEIAAAPAAAAVMLLGSTGLDEESSRRFAEETLEALRPTAYKLSDRRRYEDAAPLLERVLLLERESEHATADTCRRLVVDVLPKLGAYDRAVEVQLDCIKDLEAAGQAKAIVDSKVPLGTAYSQARDYEEAEKSFNEAIKHYTDAGDELRLAFAHKTVSDHYKRKGDFANAASALEAAVRLFEKNAAKVKKLVDLGRLVRDLGAMYLNLLSDTVRARAAYERALAMAKEPAEGLDATLALARVARRRGEFDEAEARAEQGRQAARKAKRRDVEVDAVIEAANIAWYRGDYASGGRLCDEARGMAEQNLVEARKSRVAVLLQVRRVIYALSVCGLIEMSSRDFASAQRYLKQAARMARANNIPDEEAAQYNNLGRVYLEFGRLDDAIDTFRKAQAIDERRNDRFGLAYDVRNLGTALASKGRIEEAGNTLSRALDLSRAVQDTNNELRTLFALAENARAQKKNGEAEKHYAAALPMAERLNVTELIWQIHRALGLMRAEAGDTAGAEAALKKAVAAARTLTGRAAPTDFGPHRYAAFDDLMLLLIAGGRTAEAFEIAELVRRLGQTELLDDPRLDFSAAEVPRLLQGARQASTATAAEAAVGSLARLEPGLARLLEVAPAAEIAKTVPSDAAVLVFRMTDSALVAFVIDASGVTVKKTDVNARAFRGAIRDYLGRLAGRADLGVAGAELSRLLLAPIRDRIEGKKRLALVLHGALKYVPFAALPFGGEPGSASVMIDHFVIEESLDPRSAAASLKEPLPPLGSLSIVALGGAPAAPSSGQAPLEFALKELDVIREEYPRAELLRGDAAEKRSLLAALARDRTVVHFAGHTRLEGSDPMSGELSTAKEPLRLFDVLGQKVRSPLVVLSACDTLLGAPSNGGVPSGEDLLSLAESFRIAGATAVLATTLRVGDVPAALLMKRFYRAGRAASPAVALREAQLLVRRYHPHPAWWATFTLLSGG